MYLSISELRVAKVAKAFKEAGSLNFAKVFEEVDPQMGVARKLCGVAGALTPLLLAINACVSYLLTGRGEEYWSSFARYVASVRSYPRNYLEVIELVKDFVSRSRYHARGRVAKLSRLSKLLKCRVLSKFEDPNLEFIRDPRTLLKTLVGCLGSSEYSKTLVFAVKMYYYGIKACYGKNMVLPRSIKIPVDRRIAYLTYTSGMVEVGDEVGREDIIETLMKRSRIVRLAWDRVSALSEIPPLHLDAPLWIIGRYVKPEVKVGEVVRAVNELIRGRLPRRKVELVVKELLYKYSQP